MNRRWQLPSIDRGIDRCLDRSFSLLLRETASKVRARQLAVVLFTLKVRVGQVELQAEVLVELEPSIIGALAHLILIAQLEGQDVAAERPALIAAERAWQAAS